MSTVVRMGYCGDMGILDVVLVGGPLDGATERVLAPCPDTLSFYEDGEMVTYAYAGFRDRGFEGDLVCYFLTATEFVAA